MLLLDEPTAHLDRASADVVHDAIRDFRGRATVILVAHDRQTRELADQLVSLTPSGSATRGRSRSAGPPRTPARTIVHPCRPRQRTANAAAAPPRVRRPPSNVRPEQRSTAAGHRADGRAAGRLLAPVGGRFAAAGIVGTLAALFAIALSGLSGWLILRASEQPPILYLLTAIVGVRFFGIGRAVLRYCERLLLHETVFASLTMPAGHALGVAEPAGPVPPAPAAGRQRARVPSLTTSTPSGTCCRGLSFRRSQRGSGGGRRRNLGLAAAGRPAGRSRHGCRSLAVAPAAALVADRMSAGTEQRLRSGVLRRIAAALDAGRNCMPTARQRPSSTVSARTGPRSDPGRPALRLGRRTRPGDYRRRLRRRCAGTRRHGGAAGTGRCRRGADSRRRRPDAAGARGALCGHDDGGAPVPGAARRAAAHR